MTFTYDGTPNTDLERVRLAIGDTVSTDALLTDEEIDALMALEGSSAGVELWAARCCEAIATKFARDFNFTADGTTVDKGDRAKAYREMAAEFRRRTGGGLGVVQTRHDDGWQANRGVTHADVDVTGSTSDPRW
ncbi:MAG: hypothetical protein WC211_01215 [Dehalococcoidia bacterium]